MSNIRKCFKLVEITISDLNTGDLFILNGGDSDTCKADTVFKAEKQPSYLNGVAMVECNELGSVEKVTKPV